MSGFEIIAGLAGVAGTAMQVAGTLQAGREQEARYEYEQKVQQQQADEAEAASQRDAQARYREGQLMLSQQRAAIAGSGGLSDPSVIDLMDDTQERVTLAAETDIYKGKQQAKGYNDAATVAGINADNAMKAARISAGAQLFSGVSSMFSRFGQQQKKTSSASGATAPLYGYG